MEVRRMFSSKWPRIPTFFSQHLKVMQRKSKNNQIERNETLNGMMTFGTIDGKQHLLDFTSTEFAEVEPFIADCKVQAMRDGNVYITEKLRRQRNKPLFREDNSSLTLGRDGRFYFVFTLPQELVDELPEQLVLQVVAIAKKVVEKLKIEK